MTLKDHTLQSFINQKSTEMQFHSAEKISTSLASIACITPFRLNNLMQPFLVTVYQTLTSTGRNPPLLYSTASTGSCLRAFLHAQPSSRPPQHFDRIEIWTLLGYSITLYFFFLSHSVVALLVCFGSLSCCKIHVRQHFDI